MLRNEKIATKRSTINMEVFSVILLLVVTTTAGREYTDEELSSFPKLFHLDDYDRCLARTDGLYCLGNFDLTPRVQPHPTYELLKEYSAESHRHFNRTLIHRGYCVSSRCPKETSRNASQRFENCVNKWTRARNLRASINTFHYCHTHADKYAEQPVTPAQKLFLQCVCAIIALNVVGTIYNVFGGPHKNPLITAFSIPANWQRLTTNHESSDPRLKTLSSLNAIRVFGNMFTIYLHTRLLTYGFYTLNPEFLERETQRIDTVFIYNGTSLIQALVMMSCFLTGYNLLIFSQKRSLNLFLLPLLIIRRYIRSAPVAMLLFGFTATWRPSFSSGPLAPITAGAESIVCQRKFWSSVFFYSNLVDNDTCIPPSWFLPVDMYMYIMACVFTLILWRHRRAAIILHTLLFLTSCVVVAIVAYIKNYKATFFETKPENLRFWFGTTPSMREFYISSWGSIPSCFLGLLLAHILFELDEKRINLSDYKWFVYLHYGTFPIFVLLWPLRAIYGRGITSPIYHAIYVLFDRPFHCILACIMILGCAHIDGPIKRAASWSIWGKLSNVSLAVMLLHWCVNMTIAARPVAFNTSLIDTLVDFISTAVLTYCLAVPVTLLVEIPAQKFLRLLMF